MRRICVAWAVLAGTVTADEVGYQPGQLHPDFELPRLDGRLGRLSDYRGRPVVLINFASW